MDNITQSQNFSKSLNLVGNLNLSETIPNSGKVILNDPILSSEMAEMLKEIGVTSIVMKTGELLEVPMVTSKKRDKNKSKHKNKLGYIDPSVSGIDIGDKLIHVSIPNGNGGVFVKEYGTTTPELKMIVNDLKKASIKTGVMESTGVYWIPLYEILEQSGLEAVLVDAKTVKNAPGRKSDVLDCQWIQTLYSNGLLRAAFRPPENRIKLRSLVRNRFGIIKTRQYALLRMEKALQLMNVKLSTAVSDIAGVSGIAIIHAIVKGKRDPVYLAQLRNINCKKPEEVFINALTGNYRDEHVFSLKQAFDLYNFAEGQLKECDEEIQKELESYPTVTSEPLPERDKDKKNNGKKAYKRKPKKNEITFDVRTLLWEKSGVDLTALTAMQASSALTIFAELGGTNMDHWETEKHFGSWLKLCPGNNISGGKSRRSPKQPCANYVTQTLRMCAMSAKKSDTALGAAIRRITGRTDKPQGIKAGAHKLSHMIYHMCKGGWKYYEKGADFYEKQHEERIVKGLEKKAKKLGYALVKDENLLRPSEKKNIDNNPAKNEKEVNSQKKKIAKN